MAERPFREKGPSNRPKGAARAGKSEFEDKVHQEFGDLLKRFEKLQEKILNPKPEKDESAEKYAKDFGDVNKRAKDSKDSKDAKEHKHEKAEKERKEVVKESDSGGLQVFSDPAVDQRLAALESVVGRLSHFIKGTARPDLSKGALKEEQ